jgi:hypothetical protein
MNTRKVVLASSLLVCLIFAVVVAIHAQQSAGVQMAQPGGDISSGKPLVLEVTLDKPLPADSPVIAKVRPEGASQQIIQLQASASDDAGRRKFTLRTVMPTPVVPGKWTVDSIFIILPGSTNWQPIEHNPLTFEVQGKPFEIPSKADVTLGQ